MGDSACLLHAFSYTSAIPTEYEPNQGNPMHSLGESVSFGRFMSESLAWEKWSTFSHNRYVEEAERYARPGSVAQKKAFFEAHYKQIAAKKAAALLEQANNPAASISTEPEAESDAISDSQPVTSNAALPEHQDEDSEPGFVVINAEYDNVQNLNFKPISVPAATTDQEVMEPPLLAAAVKNDSSTLADSLENQNMVSEYAEHSGTPQMEKPLLQQASQNLSSDQDVPSVKSKKKSAFSSLKSSVYRKASRVPSSPAKPVTPLIRKDGSASYATTPITSKKKHAIDLMEKKRSTPKSLNKFINSTPVKLLNNALSPARASRKMDNSKIAPDSSKFSKKCDTPLGNQTMEPSARIPKHPSAATPCSANSRTKTPVDGSKTAGPKWHILSAVCSKSLTACRNKLQSPTLSTPFILRTEERAARRKQKLEEKFNSKEEIEKVQLQTTLKEKAELELRKLRQSFCFKARPLPDFYKEREARNNLMQKNPVTQPHSPKLGRKPSSQTMQGTVSLTSSISLFKNGNSKLVSGKTNLAASSLPEKINHENASPNIQH